MSTGKVWLVGAGPGDPGLFTVKGREILQNAEVVVYDSLVGQGVLSQIPKEAKAINVGKRASHHTAAFLCLFYQDLIDLLLGHSVMRSPFSHIDGFFLFWNL